MTEMIETPSAAIADIGAAGTAGAASRPGASAGGQERPAPPAGLPEKFWDSERGELRTETLIKSYRSLEQKLGALGGQGVPADPGGYEIKSGNDLIASDPQVNERLHTAGFSQEQAQTVYDLAADYMLPLVNDVAAEFQAQAQTERLAHHFGGDDKWRETATQLRQWGRTKLPPEIYEALATTYEGVLAMHRMMGSGEPGLLEGAGNGGGAASEDRLRAMMQDPRYWRDHDPAFIRQVEDGFRRLYPDRGSD